MNPKNIKRNKLSIFFITIILIIICLILFTLINSILKENNSSKKATSNSKILLWGSQKRGALGEILTSDNIAFNNARELNYQNDMILSLGYQFYTTLKNGKVSSMGDNRAGQIGDGKQFISQPQIVPLDLNMVKQISSGYSHSLAVGENGKVYSWGLNLTNQLGRESTNNLPMQIQGLENIEKVFAGYRSSFAINKDGEIYEWGGYCSQSSISEYDKINELSKKISGSVTITGGYYDRGSVGIDEPSNINDCNPLSLEYMAVKSKIPKKLDGLKNIVEISSGYGHMLALDKEGKVWSFGCNLYGQLGRNENKNDLLSQTPLLVEGLEGKKIVQIDAGFRHSMLLDSDGIVYVAGHNEYGEMGDGSKKDKTIGFSKVENLPKVNKILSSHDYSLVLDAEGTLWGFGSNQFNQLTDNKDIKEILLPQKITDNKFTDVYSNGAFIIGITNSSPNKL
jgi:alpha-tubulin suppressor-like RCC1 family protein